MVITPNNQLFCASLLHCRYVCTSLSVCSHLTTKKFALVNFLGMVGFIMKSSYLANFKGFQTGNFRGPLSTVCLVLKGKYDFPIVGGGANRGGEDKRTKSPKKKNWVFNLSGSPQLRFGRELHFDTGISSWTCFQYKMNVGSTSWLTIEYVTCNKRENGNQELAPKTVLRHKVFC